MESPTSVIDDVVTTNKEPVEISEEANVSPEKDDELLQHILIEEKITSFIEVWGDKDERGQVNPGFVVDEEVRNKEEVTVSKDAVQVTKEEVTTDVVEVNKAIISNESNTEPADPEGSSVSSITDAEENQERGGWSNDWDFLFSGVMIGISSSPASQYRLDLEIFGDSLIFASKTAEVFIHFLNFL